MTGSRRRPWLAPSWPGGCALRGASGRRSRPSSGSPRPRRSGWPGGSAREPRTNVRRAIIATLGCAGLRNSELCALDICDLDFAHGVIDVRDSKTEAGVRKINMTPWLRDELLSYRATRARRAARRPGVPYADRRSARQGQHQPSRDRARSPRREWAPRPSASNRRCLSGSRHTRFAGRSSR